MQGSICGFLDIQASGTFAVTQREEKSTHVLTALKDVLVNQSWKAGSNRPGQTGIRLLRWTSWCNTRSAEEIHVSSSWITETSVGRKILRFLNLLSPDTHQSFPHSYECLEERLSVAGKLPSVPSPEFRRKDVAFWVWSLSNWRSSRPRTSIRSLSMKSIPSVCLSLPCFAEAGVNNRSPPRVSSPQETGVYKDEGKKDHHTHWEGGELKEGSQAWLNMTQAHKYGTQQWLFTATYFEPVFGNAWLYISTAYKCK